VVIGFERTMVQDVAFGLRRLVDIGNKALSPAINDPYTGIQAVHHLSVLLRMLAGRRLGDRLHHDVQGTLRVAVPLPQFADLPAARHGPDPSVGGQGAGRDPPRVRSASSRLKRSGSSKNGVWPTPSYQEASAAGQLASTCRHGHGGAQQRLHLLGRVRPGRPALDQAAHAADVGRQVVGEKALALLGPAEMVLGKAVDEQDRRPVRLAPLAHVQPQAAATLHRVHRHPSGLCDRRHLPPPLESVHRRDGGR
jgi:hypothetical protein